jgi:serine O-acetyltransferase
MSMQNMITNTIELQNFIQADQEANLGKKPVTMEMRFRSGFPYQVCQYLKVVRKLEYTCWKRDHSKNRLGKIFCAQKVKLLDRRRNRMGLKLGIEIPVNRVASGVRIAHPNVILNGYVGEDCVFHGNNVLGNKRTGDGAAIPKLGKNVDVGVGAMIIGDVEIADGCVIGAGAVVTKSFLQRGTVIAGVPAKEINI